MYASQIRNIPIYIHKNLIIPDSIEINATTIKRQTEVKLIGITIDKKNLNLLTICVKSVDNWCKTVAMIINIMYKFGKYLWFKRK